MHTLQPIEFTFQYGDIQILIDVKNKKLIEKFTFQYGDIQIQSTAAMLMHHSNLHSNLVIFKFSKFNERVFCKFRFTFQYGDIQIFLFCVN